MFVLNKLFAHIRLTSHPFVILSQTPFYLLKQILTYKAPSVGKTVISVNPSYTSQIDHRTGLKDGVRKGMRYTCKDGVVLHADFNAAINIRERWRNPLIKKTNRRLTRSLDGLKNSNTPILEGNSKAYVLDNTKTFGRGLVKDPNVGRKTNIVDKSTLS